MNDVYDSPVSNTVLGVLDELKTTLNDADMTKDSRYLTALKQPILELVDKALEIASSELLHYGNCHNCAYYQRAEDLRVAHECMDRLRRLAESGNCPLTKDEIDNLEQFI